MRNLIVMGTGRSGSSVTAGLFRNVPNIFMGFRLLDIHESNPLGFWEDVFVNTINNLLIREAIDGSSTDESSTSHQIAPPFEEDPALANVDSYWLVRPHSCRNKSEPSEFLVDAMRALVERHPFCLKDPRFSCTWPFWENIVPPETGCLVVFRHPAATINSMVHDCSSSYEPPLPWNHQQALDLWIATYRRILDDYSKESDFFFISYDNVLCGKSLPALERFAGQNVDSKSVTARLNRASCRFDVPVNGIEECLALYDELLEEEVKSIMMWEC